tara:strand:- start:11214 stop:11366 length:153 start_codon:yes stop_codon:yes gene_type:complete
VINVLVKIKIEKGNIKKGRGLKEVKSTGMAPFLNTVILGCEFKVILWLVD